MSELGNLLRLLVQGDKEAKITSVTVTDSPTLFTSQLISGQTRRGLFAYNNSNTGSGEVYYGYSADISAASNSQPIPKGAIVQIPVASVIDVYFVSDAGEVGDLRVEEVA